MRKYHESEDTHRTSISGVSIPRCNIDLNPSVSGNGSLTIRHEKKFLASADHLKKKRKKKGRKPSRTQHETLEKEINPSHDNHLRNHHNHLRLHTRHHTIHRSRVCHGVWRSSRCTVRTGFGRTIFEIGACFECVREVVGYGEVERGWSGRVGGGCSEDLRADEGTPVYTISVEWVRGRVITYCSRTAALGCFFGGDCSRTTT